MKIAFFSHTLAALVLVTVFSAAGSAHAADATGNASATIATPISVSENTSLSFGTVLAGASQSTIVVSTAGGRTLGSGDATLFGGTPAAAVFDVTGEGSASYSVSFTAGTLTRDGGSETMTVDTFTNDSGGSIGGGGSDSFNVGATLTVAANQVAGSYTGTYTVSVDYQ
ncbi:MAG: DUF4402 domain-containing protein [Rhodospirillales bacterium]